MKVTLLNEDEVKDLYKNWGEFASICYDTHTKHPEKVGEHCKNSGHYSGSRSRYFVFKVEEVPRFVIDQAVRAEVGACKNVQSFRYVDKGSFSFEIPVEIKDNNDLLDRYMNHMFSTIDLYEDIQEYVFNKTGKKERANEQARYVLPMATHSAFVIGFTVEALIHYMNVRLCSRTEDVHRQMALLLKKEALNALPSLKDDLVPNCQRYLWCPEGIRCCGAAPTKDEIKEMLRNK